MIKRALFATAFAAGAMVTSAHAAEWTGLYLGVHGGGAWGDVDTTTVSNTTNGFWEVPAGGSFSTDADGVLGGGQLGYNYQFSNWVFGVEASGSFLDFDDKIFLTSDDIYSVEVDWLASATARLGYALRPTSLLYVKGGYAAGGVKTSEVDDQVALLGAFSTDETHGGWTAGAGFEQKISERVSLALEYDYIDLGNQDHAGAATTGGAVVNDIDVQMHAVTARLNWQLWAP